MIPLIRPYITEETKVEVNKVLDSGYLTEGLVTKNFEEACRNHIGCSHAIALCNCTLGLEIALRALGIGPGDEVIVPDYTYPATASAVNIMGATVVLVDIDPENMLIDYNALEAAVTEKTKAAIPVSLFGNPLDWGRLRKVKKKYGIYFVEDAACSLGAEYKGEKVGNQADISVFSLHPRKFITTGEGGLVTTNNQNWADWILSYKHFGMGVRESRLTTTFDRVGGNYKLSNILAAVGLVQMRHIHDLLGRRREIAGKYLEDLRDVDGIGIPETTVGGKHSYQSCCVFVEDRDNIMEEMRQKGIETQIGTYSLHKHKAFYNNENCRIQGDMRGSCYAFDHCLTLPMYNEMTEEEQRCVIDELKTQGLKLKG